IEELANGRVLAYALAEPTCICCGREMEHLFLYGRDTCLVCRQSQVAHDGLAQGICGQIRSIVRDPDDGLVFLWCYGCRSAWIEDGDLHEFLETLFNAVPEATRRHEVVTASVRRRYQN